MKQNLRKNLALFGGKQTLTIPAPHFIWPPITKNIEKAVLQQLHKSISIYDRSGVFLEFENKFANYHRRKYALLCSSGTTAIHSMFIATGLKEGDEVICPVYTFFATVTPLLFIGAKPILCDIDKNGNIDPEEIKKKITKRTRAVVITHMWGIPCKMDPIIHLCKQNKLLLLEDCSHAHGARYRNRLVGTFGDIATWSLQGPKVISGGEGGILLTDNKEFYYRALLLGHYNKRCKQEIPKNHKLYKYHITGMGLKYRAHPLAISIALFGLKNLDKWLKVKRNFAKQIINELKRMGGVQLPELSREIKPSWYALILQYKKGELENLPIEHFYKALVAEGLTETDRPGSTCPLNLLPLFQNPKFLFPIYKKYPFHYKKGDFPRAEEFYQNAIKIPVWAFQKDSKIVGAYIRGIKKVINNYRDLL